MEQSVDIVRHGHESRGLAARRAEPPAQGPACNLLKPEPLEAEP